MKKGLVFLCLNYRFCKYNSDYQKQIGKNNKLCRTANRKKIIEKKEVD